MITDLSCPEGMTVNKVVDRTVQSGYVIVRFTGQVFVKDRDLMCVLLDYSSKILDICLIILCKSSLKTNIKSRDY